MLKNFSKIWWRIAGSNRWPPECKSGALPAELIPLIKMVGRERLELSTPPLSRVCSNQLSYRPFCWMNSFTNIRDKEEKRGRLQCTMLSDSSKVNFWTVLRKEVIQPQVPLRLPCYDLVPIIKLTFGACVLAVRSATSGPPNSRGLTGGVYKAQEHIHRGMLTRDY